MDSLTVALVLMGAATLLIGLPALARTWSERTPANRQGLLALLLAVLFISVDDALAAAGLALPTTLVTVLDGAVLVLVVVGLYQYVLVSRGEGAD